MFLRRLLLCLSTAVGIASFQVAHAQPVRSCPDGQAVNSLQPNGTPAQCIPVAPPSAVSAEASARAAADAQLQANIDALQPSPPTGATRCYGTHFVRSINGNELHFTTIFINNGDLQNPAVVDRITIRDDFGTILHDSGPKIGIPHPPALAPIPPLDITTVPPGGTFGWSSTDIWSFNNAPQFVGRGLRSISLTAEVSKAGDPKLVTVHARQIVRQRLVDATGNGVALGDERSNNSSTCFEVPRS